MILNFAYNPTSWDNGPIPGGMADCLVRPILPHLTTEHRLTDRPQAGTCTVLYTHLRTYQRHDLPARTVFVSHGIADKRWRDARRVTRYDHVFVSGPAWVQRLKAGGLASKRIHEVGYAKLDPIVNGELTSPWPARDGRIRVLWAPTHGGGGERHAHAATPPKAAGAKRSSHWRRDEILELLPPSEFQVMVALHPRHRPDGRSTLAEYVGADVVIADGGSTIYEAWALDLPVVFPDWIVAEAMTHNRRTFEADLYRQRIGRHATDPSDLPRLVTEATEGITDREQAFVEPILPRALRGRSGRAHAEVLDEIAR